jgi:hypothetical protein
MGVFPGGGITKNGGVLEKQLEAKNRVRGMWKYNITVANLKCNVHLTPILF